MASLKDPKDITDQLREAARSITLTQGLNQVKFTASLIMPKPLQRSAFTASAIETMRNVSTLQAFILAHLKNYTDRHRSTEHDRDNIEREVSSFVNSCRKQIELLKDSIGRSDNTIGNGKNADLIAHQHGMVLILSERLHDVTAIFDRFRSVRFKEAIEKTRPRWRKRVPPQEVPSSAELRTANWDAQDAVQQEAHPEVDYQQTLLDEETRALQVELSNLLDAAQETETKMVEISALNHFFSTQVLHQAQQIELLYQQALDATQNVQKGNKELTKAIDRTRSSRTFLLLFLFVLPLAVLFLHWYKG